MGPYRGKLKWDYGSEDYYLEDASGDEVCCLGEFLSWLYNREVVIHVTRKDLDDAVISLVISEAEAINDVQFENEE